MDSSNNARRSLTEQGKVIQPNSVTNARYQFKPIAENILTLILEVIQDSIPEEDRRSEKTLNWNNTNLDQDLFGEPMLRIRAADAAERKPEVLQSLKELREKTISYRWKSDKDGLERVTYTGLISAYSDVVGTDYVDITLSKWAQPFLSYIGQYVGATYYNKVTALSLPGSYSKRMYKLCKQWERKGFIPEMSLSEFKDLFSIPVSYPKARVQERILEKSQEEFLKHGSDMSFEFKWDRKRNKKGKKEDFLQITLVGGMRSEEKEAEKENMYKYVLHFLRRVYDGNKTSKPFDIVEKLSENTNDLEMAYRRFCKLDDEVSNGSKKEVDLIRITKTIINDDDFGIYSPDKIRVLKKKAQQAVNDLSDKMKS